jgi:hypothetical protein
VYRLQVMNTSEQAHLYRIEVDGVKSAGIADEDVIELEGASARAVPVRVRTAPGEGRPGSNKIAFTVTALDDPSLKVREQAVFIIPR